MNPKEINIKEVESKIDYSFNDKKLLEQALTHRSFTNEQKNSPHNETFEFLGDAILQFISTKFLFSEYKDLDEGILTLYRSAIVKTDFLADIGKKIGLDSYIRTSVGQGIEDKIIGDCIEALVGSIYLDSNLEKAEKFINSKILKDTKNYIESISVMDPKTELQEKTQADLKITPIYEVLSESGPDHNKTFEVGIKLDKDEIVMIGSGNSKQAAAKDAASKLLKEYKKLIR